MEERIQNIESNIGAIKARNARVEADKAWELSWFRVLSITVLIYAVAVSVFVIGALQRPFLSSLIPATGYFLSVQTLPMLKRWWIQNQYTHRGN